MDKIPSAFNDLWEFLFVPLLEFIILLSIIYVVSDKIMLKERINKLFELGPSKLQNFKMNIAEPLGISGVIGVGMIVIVIAIVVACSRISHLIGEAIPGTISYSVESSMLKFGDFGPYAKVWARHPEIEDVHQLNSYVTSVIAKNGSSYPEISSTLKWTQERFSDIINWQNFEKFLLVYVLIVVPLLCKLFKIKIKYLFLRIVVLLCVVFFFLAINFYNGYRAVKRIFENNSYACQIIMAEDISKVKDAQAQPFIKKFLDYNNNINRSQVVFLHFNTFIDL